MYSKYAFDKEEFNLNGVGFSVLYKNLDKINWYALSKNPGAIPLLMQNFDKINWGALSGNTSAIPLLEQNFDKIDWYLLSSNPAAIHLLKDNMDKVDMGMLHYNPAGIHLLDKEVDFFKLSNNPDIFEYDYETMCESRHVLHEELLSLIYHPDNLAHFKQCLKSVNP
jgi:hypothetical protein